MTLLTSLSSAEWALIAVNLLLLVFAGEIYDRLALDEKKERGKQVHLVRLINIVVIGLVLYRQIDC